MTSNRPSASQGNQAQSVAPPSESARAKALLPECVGWCQTSEEDNGPAAIGLWESQRCEASERPHSVHGWGY